MMNEIGNATLRWSVFISVCLAAGCGQSDPDAVGADGGNETSAPDASTVPEPTNAEEALDTYYPVPDGAYWQFDHVGGDEIWQEEVNLEEITYEGEPAILQTDTPGPSGTHSESTLVRKDAGIYRVHKETIRGDTLEETADYDPGFVRFRGQWVIEGPGYTETLEYRRRSYDENGTLKSDEPRKHRYTVEEVGVALPDTDYENCVRINRIRMRAGDEPLKSDDDKDYYYCPGVGKVREVDRLEGKLEELVECDIPGGACP